MDENMTPEMEAPEEMPAEETSEEATPVEMPAEEEAA